MIEIFDFSGLSKQMIVDQGSLEKPTCALPADTSEVVRLAKVAAGAFDPRTNHSVLESIRVQT